VTAARPERCAETRSIEISARCPSHSMWSPQVTALAWDQINCDGTAGTLRIVSALAGPRGVPVEGGRRFTRDRVLGPNLMRDG
jgi:hypothetical protein